MTNLALGLLGSLRVTVADASAATFESDRARALLAYLAVESNQPHRRGALVGLLWPDCPEDVARRNLRQTLYNVRQVIGDRAANPPYLLISRDEIQFNLASDYTLDVSTFITLLDTCDKHLPRCIEACPIHADRLRQAMALYSGPFLQEFFLADSAEFEEWAVRQREAIHARALEALTYLANYSELGGEYEAARRWAARLLELDPWREEAHRQAMRVLAASGLRSAALAQYETCRRVLAKELGVDPSAETRQLYEQISRGEVGVRRSQPHSTIVPAWPTLPVSLTPFIGRDRELAEIGRLLADPDCRLLTLVGPGGIGKTRLALQVAATARSSFSDGAAIAELAPVDSATLIAPAIAGALGLVFSGPLDPKTQLLNYMRGKEMLLVMDNMEHLLDGPGLFGEILEQAPRVKLLVTSREQLNMLGEWLFEVQGLELPADETAESFEQSSAVALFVQRARRTHMGLQLSSEERSAVIRICRLVDGMPLAIELAASWVRALSTDEIEREIERNLDFLATSMRDLPERHRSMRAVFDHSWKLLSAEEQAVLARLSVFRGGFQREAAEAVAGAGLPLLSALLSKSFLRRMPSGRHDLHELVRQYAADRLRENPDEEAATRDRHSEYYTDFGARQENHLKGPRQLKALAETAAEMENIRIAWRHSVTGCCIESIRKPIRAFWSLYEMRGWYQEAEAFFGWAADELERNAGTALRQDKSYQVALAQIQSKQGWFAVRIGKREEARNLLEPSRRALRSLGAGVELAHALHHLGVLDWQAGDSVRARADFLEELAIATNIEDRWEIALARGNLGIATQSLGEHREALEIFQSALAEYRALGDERMVAVGLYYLGAIECELGMCAAAQDSLRESITKSRRVGDSWLLGMALSALGDALGRAEGDVQEAVTSFRESLALFEQVGERWSTVEALNRLGNVKLRMNADAEAREVFARALSLAREIRLLPGILEAIVGIAEWQMKKGQPEPAWVLLTKVLSETSIPKARRDRAERLRLEMEQQLTQQQIEIANARAQANSLEIMVRELESARD